MHCCAYTWALEFVWDPRKAAANLRKHGVDFADAGTVFHDEQAIGMDALGRVLVVVYTWREDSPRLISARKATARERRQYEGAR